MGNGKAIAGFVLGIVGNLLALSGMFVVTAWLALPLAVTGLVLSVSAGKTCRAYGQTNGFATAGLIIGIIGVVFATISFMTCGLCLPIVSALSKPDPNDVAVFF